MTKINIKCTTVEQEGFKTFASPTSRCGRNGLEMKNYLKAAMSENKKQPQIQSFYYRKEL